MLVPVSGVDTIACERVGGGLNTGEWWQVVLTVLDSSTPPISGSPGANLAPRQAQVLSYRAAGEKELD